MEDQLIYEIGNHEIEIYRSSWSQRARVTVRDDYKDEITKYKWSLVNGYPHNNKLGYLHIYVMRKWYGDNICDEMKEKNFVIDHMNNNHMDATIRNLAFLNSDENIAKGHHFDKVNKEKMYIALSMFRDFEKKLFQVTIFFNYPAKIVHPDVTEPAVLNIACLLYEDDYSKVIFDCQHILNEYYKNFTISLMYLRCIDYDLEGYFEEQYPKELHDYYISGKHGHGVCHICSKAPMSDWDTNTKLERFYLHPRIR